MTVICPRCGSPNTWRMTDPWGGYTGPYAHVWQCLNCDAPGRDDGRPFTFDPRDTMFCACCGGECDRDPYRLPDYLASLCDTCASGSCDACNGLASGADTPGSGYVEMREELCPTCDGHGITSDYGDHRTCGCCAGLGYTVDPSHGLTSMSPEWCHYLTLTSEDCRNV